ncbi:hypothetical protein [Bradyrhizobium yuanmingense]|uniref:hypothetical protein n=1 Tax=Bradyrhizobium yuanmingense TaxID=108015 RepID=UPI0023B9CF46|nr:hypothetical protein [Bradyrhizobium yuanmingense]MDF0495736.1 hypothetical protein [Bradyrhizobium yuanmingense]
MAFFKALNGRSAAGSTGTGRVTEKGVTFNWKLDSKLPHAIRRAAAKDLRSRGSTPTPREHTFADRPAAAE